MVWKIYPGKAHWALVKLLWQNIQKKKKKNGNHIYEACESMCHECSAKYKVENVDEKQDDKKYLKLQWDIDYADEVQEIKAARTPMKKYACVCDM